MGTKLGAVVVPVQLDLSAAQRQLDEFERRARTSPGRGAAHESARPDEPLFGDGPGAPRRPGGREWPQFRDPRLPRGMMSTRRDIASTGNLIDRIEKRDAAMGRLRTLAQRSRHGGGLGDPNAPPGTGMLADLLGNVSRTALLARSPTGFMRTAARAAPAVMTAAAIYEGAAIVGKTAPFAFAFGRGLGGGGATADARIAVLEKELERFRNLFVEFEAHIKSYFTGYAKALQMTGAASRITGQTPSLPVPGLTSTSTYYQFFQKADEEDISLEKKFAEFRGKEIAQAFGKYVRDNFKRALNQ